MTSADDVVPTARTDFAIWVDDDSRGFIGAKQEISDRSTQLSRRNRHKAESVVNFPHNHGASGAPEHLAIRISELQAQLERGHAGRAIAAQTNAE
jgi:hypothetical protein